MTRTNIQYLIGDATDPRGEGPKLIAHICNDVGGWGRGFVLAISKRWRKPETEYRQWYRDRAENGFDLGALQLVQVEPDLWVVNMIGQRDIKPGPQGPPVRYDAIEEALGALAREAEAIDASVHMPRIGCGLSGGDWEIVEPIIFRTLCTAGVPTFVYDLP